MGVYPAKKPSRLLIAILVMATVTVIVGGVAIVALMRTFNDVGRAAGEVVPAEREYRALGFPWIASGVRTDGVLTSNQNAASLFREAFAKLPSKSISHDASLIRKAYDAGKTANAEQLMAGYGPSLEIAMRASRLSGLDFGREWDMGLEIKFPELAEFKGFGRILGVRAEIESSHKDGSGAIRDLQAIWNMGELVAQEPTMISGLVSISLRSNALTEIQRCAYELREDQGSLSKLQAFAKSLKLSNSPFATLRGESYMGLATIRNLKNYGGVEQVLENESSVKPLDRSTLVRTGLPADPMSRAFAARHMQFWIQVQKLYSKHPGDLLGFYRDFDQLGKEVADRRALSSVLVSMVADLLPGYVAAHLRLSALLVADQALMTALMQRAKTGKLPSRLDEIPGTWIDPFSGKPMLVKQSGGSLRVYSVGPNGKDDGGVDRFELKDKDSGDWDIPAAFPPIRPQSAGR